MAACKEEMHLQIWHWLGCNVVLTLLDVAVSTWWCVCPTVSSWVALPWVRNQRFYRGYCVGAVDSDPGDRLDSSGSQLSNGCGLEFLWLMWAD